jgi:tetratricopeptide (TPR) repeat protein
MLTRLRRCRSLCGPQPAGMCLVVVVGMVLVVPGWGAAEAGNRMIDAWAGVQQQVAAEDAEGLVTELQQLEEVVDELAIERVTPFAEAMTARAATSSPEVAGELLTGAQRLDPVLPSPAFLLARLDWIRGDYLGSVVNTARGTVNLIRHGPTRWALLTSLVPWIAVTLGVVIAVVIVLQVLTTLRRVAFDAYQLGQRLFGRANAIVFAVVLVSLPLFAGLGPTWLLVYLFGLTWVYVDRSQRWWPPAILAVLLLVSPSLRLWTWMLATPTGLAPRVEVLFDQRQLDFGALQEFVSLEENFGRSEAYHVVAGELHRMHGNRDGARLQFEKAVVANPNSLISRVALAALALEEGNVSIAIQRLDEVITINQNVALAHFNLATAYDQIRRFQQGDAARDRARELGGMDLSAIAVPGREPRIAFPRLGSSWVEQVVREAPSDIAPILTGERDTGSLWRILLDPIALVALFGLIFGGAALFALERWHPPARQCSKCGKLFSAKAGTSESTVYCSQCVSVFLKRDVVSIEQQTAKMRQVHRWEFLARWWRRLASVVVPGGYHMVNQRGGIGLLWTFLVWFPLVGALVWVPLYVRYLAPDAPVSVLQWTLGLTGAALWVVSAVSYLGRR